MKGLDALIVGAGPAGSAAAIALAQRGYEVALVDKQLFPREKLCGDFLNPMNRPILRELGVEERLLEQPHGTITNFRITSCSGAAAEAAFCRGDRGTEPGLALRRSVLDDVLLWRAAALGAAVHTGRRIDSLRYEAAGWQIGCGEDAWRARIVIGADGRNSRVARRLGLAAPRGAPGRAVGLQFRLHASRGSNDCIDIHLVPGGYAGVVALGDGTVNVAMAIDRRRLAGRQDPDELCDRVLSANPHLRSMLQSRSDTAELRSVFPVYFPPRRLCADGALLVGDAARVTEPVTGEGVYFALRSGLFAADAVDRALRRGDASRAGLAGYAQACRGALRPRAAWNSLFRYAVYRPALLEPMIRFSARHRALFHSMVHAVCTP